MPTFYSAQSSNLRTWAGFHGAEHFQDFDRLVEQQQSCRDSEKSSPTRRTTE
jgi:hypothetical protein